MRTRQVAHAKVIEASVTNPKKHSMLNLFQCHQQDLYNSDVLDAGGSLDKKYLIRQHLEESWSTLVFAEHSLTHWIGWRGCN